MSELLLVYQFMATDEPGLFCWGLSCTVLVPIRAFVLYCTVPQRVTELEGQVRVQRAELAQALLARQQSLAESRSQMEQLRAQLEAQRKREARFSFSSIFNKYSRTHHM